MACNNSLPLPPQLPETKNEKLKKTRENLIKSFKFIGLSDNEIALLAQTEILNVLTEKATVVQSKPFKEHTEISLIFNVY